ncbi:DJ-1/PfpI family protein [Porticoccaceae bacterium LTM1]|nr:DJ-1/PfpI family protein [Porticoccaceae bacterium LTM1]
MSKRVLIPAADGSEDMELVTLVDVLRRAGAEVTVASVMENGRQQITASRGTVITTDSHIQGCTASEWDLIAVPGGIPGAEHLRDSQELTSLLKKQAADNKPYAAICAAPAVVLAHHGLLKNRKATGHPAYQQMEGVNVDNQSRVVVDGNCVTSQGAGTALEFALVLVEMLYDSRKRGEVGEPMVAEPIYL